MSSVETAITFRPGPLGFELEPVFQADGRAIGCRVAGFKSLPDGTAGQAQRSGEAQAGDVLTEINGVPVRDTSFDKIIALLRHDTERAERHLTFESSLSTPATNPTPEGPVPVLKTAGSRSSSTGGRSTQPATPSPGSNPRPSAAAAAAKLEEQVDLGEGEQQEQQSGAGWAMRLLGMNGRGDEEDAALEEEGFPKAGVVLMCAQEGVGESDEGTRNNGDIAAGGSASASPESTPTGVDGAEGTARGEARQLQGVAQLITGNGPVGAGSGHAAESTGSAVDGGAGYGTAKLEQRSPPPPTTTNASKPGESARVDQQLLVVGTKPADFKVVTRGGNDSTDSPTLSPAKAWPKDAPGSSPSPGSARNGHQQQWRHPDNVRQATTEATMPHGCSDGGRPAAGGGGVLSTACVGYDGGDNGEFYERGFEVGSPDAAEQSLDTVSLSEATEHQQHQQHQQHGRKDVPGRRPWMVSSLWGGGGGEQAAEGTTAAVAVAAAVSESRDDEVEEVRRLARSLATKVKERVRRCEELEDFCGLRDDQVSMLQRESNSLAARATFLTEELSDMSSLVDALQRDRSRLEEELAQRGGPVEANQAGGCDCMGQGAKAPIAGVAGGACLLDPEGNVVDVASGREAGVDKAAAAAAAVAVAAVAAKTFAAEKLAGDFEASEAKARGDAAAAAEAHCVALADMVDSLLAEKMGWQEERASNAADALRLRARVRGLEEAVVECSGQGGDGDGAGGGRHELLVDRLRELLRDRTRESEEKTVGMERLAARVRELEGEKQRLNASLSAREEDILVSDREMQALSTRLKGELRESGEAAAMAEAVAEKLRRALEKTTAGGMIDEYSSGTDGNSSSRPMADSIAWAEERTRLQHNLESLTEALQDREAQAAADEEAAVSRLQTVRDDRDRFAQEVVSLREAEDSLRVELAGALSVAAQRDAQRGGAQRGEGALPAEGDESQGGALPPRDPAEVAGSEPPTRRAGGVAVGGDESVDCGGTVRTKEEKEEEEEATEGEGGGAAGGAKEGAGVYMGKGALEAEGGSCCSALRLEGAGGETVREGPEQQPVDPAVSEGPEQQRVDVISGAVGSVGPDQWFGGDCDGGIDGLQLDLMEKDIVIEQLRAQLKQARSRMAAMEEEQAADTAPLEGLLSQLGELKGSLQEREERELRCRDQVDVGLMRMERLKEESAAAAVASPPVSFAGSVSVSPPFSRQAEPPQGQVEQQRLRRQIDDLHWELQTAKRRIEERETQLRDAREETNNLKKRCRDAERDLAAAKSEVGMAATEASTERRRAGARSAELQSARAELQFVRQRAAAAAEEQRSQLLSEGRGRVSAAVAAAEAAGKDRVDALTASLRAVTAARDELLEGSGRAARESSDRAGDVAARAGQLEALRCTLAAREAELEAIVDATADFVHADAGAKGGGLGGGGGGALRGVLAAASEARRSGCVAAELREELSALHAKASEGKLELARLCAALQEAKAAEERAVAAAAAATATATAATAAAAAATAATAAAADQRALRSPQADPEKSGGGGGGGGGGLSTRETRDIDRRAQAAEDALRKALVGAEQAWRAISCCLADECRTNDDISGDNASPMPARSQQWHPASDPSLEKLVSGAETLASACRRRGDALRRATFAARAKEVCAREARRREATESQARGDAERRLEDALAALEECRRHHQQGGWASARDRAAESERGAGAGAAAARAFLTPEQEEHLRQIRNEVDRLEGQNISLRRSLVGGGERLPVHSLGRVREGGVPSQRLLFPQAFGRGRSSARWERCQGMSDSDRASARTPSPAGSWAAASAVGGTPWSQRGTSEKARLHGDLDGGGYAGDHDDGGGHDRDHDDARARVLEECAQFAPPLQDDGSGGTLVSGWATSA